MRRPAFLPPLLLPPLLLPPLLLPPLLLALTSGLVLARAGSAADAPPKAEDAIVLIRTTNSLRSGRGSGFLIGDGSWVVTASHVVSVDLGKGRRASDKTALVYSPWMGRAYEAKVAAIDGTADIALLRLPQAGLPSLAVESLDLKEAKAAKDTLQNRPLRLFGFPLTYGEDTVAALAHAAHNDSTLSDVLQRGETNLCVLNACPDVQPGWSGGPMVDVGRMAVVAVFHSLYERAKEKEGSPAGSLCGYLGDLLNRAGAGDPGPFRRPPAATLARPPDAGERMALTLRSLSWSAAGDLAKAEQELRDLVKLAPDDGLAHVELGCTLLDEQKYEPGLAELKTAAKLIPNSMLANYHLGRALHLNYDPKGAVAALRKALQASPGEVEPRLALAQVYEDNQQPEEAEAELRAARQAAPDHPVILYRLGKLLLPRNHEQGLKLLGAASDMAAVDPGLASIRLAYAKALEDARKSREAEGVYRDILRADPQNVYARYYLAVFYYRANRMDDAQIQVSAGIVVPKLNDAMLEAFRALQLKINERGGN